MPFKCAFWTDFDSSSHYSQRLEVLQWEEDSKLSDYYFSLRTFFKDGDKLKATPNGVCLNKEEFNYLLSKPNKLDPFKIGENRTFEFRQLRNLNLYELEVVKPTGSTQKMVLGKDELLKLRDLKDGLNIYCA